MTIRSATSADLDAIAAVMADADESPDWPGMPGHPYLEHLFGRPGGRLFVAEVDGAIAGMGGSIEVGSPEARFLTDLFVHPEHQSRGLGRGLLEVLFAGTTDRCTFSSTDERALGSYIRAGMRPWWPLLYLTIPRAAIERRPGETVDDDLVDEPVSAATSARWSAAWTGVDRAPDFAYYDRFPGAAGHLIRAAGASEPVAIVRARDWRTGDGRAIDHASFAPHADPVPVAMAVMRTALAGAAALSGAIPGPHPVVPRLLAGGGRIGGRDTFCATDPGLIDHERLFPSPGFL